MSSRIGARRSRQLSRTADSTPSSGNRCWRSRNVLRVARFDASVGNDGTVRVRIFETPTEELLRELLAEVRSLRAKQIVVETSHEAGEAWIRAGFSEVSRVLEAPLAVLESHEGVGIDPSYGSIHLQTDDVDAVAKAVQQTVRRLPGGSKGSVVFPPRNGWTSIFDELGDREPEMLRRLASELADRMGIVVLLIGIEECRVLRFVLFERARIMDEYLSVPEYHGPLPPGEVIALGANPRVVARLTGADPEAVRAIAQTARRPEDLPTAPEILASFATAVDIPAAVHGYGEAREQADAIVLDRVS